MVKEGISLENLVSRRGIEVASINIEDIEKLTPPTTIREV